MLLIHTQKVTPRFDFIFKHLLNRILGLDIGFTMVIEDFIAHSGPKLSYGKQPMGNEFFVQSFGLLSQLGVEDVGIIIKPWDDTVCFFSVSDRSSIPFDIFSAAFYLLSRYEEYLPHVKDEQGRFPATESLAYKEKFLLQPVVDIWAYKMEAALKEAFPDYDFPLRQPSIHSLIKIQQPYQFAKKGFVRSLAGFTRDLSKLRFRSIFRRIKVLSGFESDPLDVYEWIIDATRNSKSKLTAFFLLGEHISLRDGFNSRRKNFKWLIKYLGDYVEVGLLFSLNALLDLDMLKEEKRQMEENTHRSLRSSMNTNYLIQLPDIYRNLLEQEIERDFSMVYEDTPGFRAGTCTPFLFYDLDYEIKTPLVIHPIAFTTEGFNHKYESDSLQRILSIYNTVMKLNGTFSVFFNNQDFSDEKANDLWRNLLSEKLHPNA